MLNSSPRSPTFMLRLFGCNVWHTGTCVINQWKEKHTGEEFCCPPLVSSLILNNSGVESKRGCSGSVCSRVCWVSLIMTWDEWGPMLPGLTSQQGALTWPTPAAAHVQSVLPVLLPYLSLQRPHQSPPALAGAGAQRLMKQYYSIAYSHSLKTDSEQRTSESHVCVFHGELLTGAKHAAQAYAHRCGAGVEGWGFVLFGLS